MNYKWVMYGLPKKVILKANKELLELHKRCITTYLIQRSLKHKYQKKFFVIYDRYINEKNIRQFFFRPIRVFVYALITDRLDDISDYIYKTSKPKKK